jgi:hypothetical protein
VASYYYRGKRHTKQNWAWKSIKKVARRFEDAIQGGHPGGAEALVERMIREYPDKRVKPDAPQAPAQEPVNREKEPAQEPVDGEKAPAQEGDDNV